jgi:hypothetical protein
MCRPIGFALLRVDRPEAGEDRQDFDILKVEDFLRNLLLLDHLMKVSDSSDMKQENNEGH